MNRLRNLSLVALAVVPFASHAADLGAANGFNAFIFGSATLNGGHADGAVAVGGSVSGSDYTTMLANLPATVGSDNRVGFYTGGSASFTNKLGVNNSGNARVGGSYTGQNGIQLNGGSLFQGAAANIDSSLFTTQQSYSNAQSDYLFSLASTAINTANPNNWTINAASVATVYGSALLVSIPASTLSNAIRTLDISGLGANQTLIINVTGSSAVNNFGVTLNGPSSRVLWNYGGSAAFDVTQRALHGSLLAPRAAVTSSQNIDGNLIAASWSNFGSAEIHAGNVTFTGYVPKAVPEPTTMAALGLGAVAMIKRRRSTRR